jgi:hypothetical protein
MSSGSWGIQDKTDNRREMVGTMRDEQYARSCVSLGKTDAGARV